MSYKKVVLVFNGEVYNFQQLKAQIKDYLFKTNSDTEDEIPGRMKAMQRKTYKGPNSIFDQG